MNGIMAISRDDEMNEDWIKTMSWDLGPDLNLDELFSVLGVAQALDAVKYEVLYAFCQLPAWIPAPNSLKDQAQTWFRDHSTPE